MALRTYDEMSFHPKAERLVEILCNKAQNNNPLFFRVLVAYYFSLVASMMRVSIETHDRGKFPVNFYTLNLAPSGAGKNLSMGVIEDNVVHLFRERFINETLPLVEQTNLAKLAHKRAVRKNTDPDDEIKRVMREYDGLGPFLFSFDSATGPAVKQYRHKLLMSGIGSMNLQMDEIGNYLQASNEVLVAFFELFDVGHTRQKLLKASAENLRQEEVIGRTPTNMVLFGTPTSLLDGSKNEDDLYKLLETGYARRCFFGYSRSSTKRLDQTALEVYDQITDKGSDDFLGEMAEHLEKLADMVNLNTTLTISKDVTLTLIEYRLQCERAAAKLGENDVIRNHELSHRYAKALKLSGAYAFIDGSPEVTEDHLYQAIKLAEQSGEAFNRLLARDRHYMKLAKYLAANPVKVTHADLYEDLPFYRGGAAQRQDMLNFAVAWGYQNNIIIKKEYDRGIEFLSGESLKETDINQIILAYSAKLADDYESGRLPFHRLHELTQTPWNFITHHLKDPVAGHRDESHMVPGFNLIVLDIDGTTTLDLVRELMKEFTYHIFTTKSHQPDKHHFRLLLPTNFELKLDGQEFREFMRNVIESMPFEVDRQTVDPLRKWACWNMHYEYNDGRLFDVLPYIPQTSRNEERKALLSSQAELDALERWMVNNTGDGNRNNMLHRFARILIDARADYATVQEKVFALNNKLPDKLDAAELLSTVLATASKAISQRMAQPSQAANPVVNVPASGVTGVTGVTGVVAAPPAP